MAKAAAAATKTPAKKAAAVKKQPAPPPVVRPSLAIKPMEAGDAKEVTSGLSTVRTYLVPVDSLTVVPGFNLRVTDHPDYQAFIADLVNSIDAEGFYDTKPLSGFVAKMPDGVSRIVITDGHGRYEAVKRLNELRVAAGNPTIDKLPMILKKPTVTALDLAVALYQENNQRNLSMIELAVMVKRMHKGGMKKADIAKRIRKTPRYVDDLLYLIDCDKDVRLLVMQGKISGTEVVKRLRAADQNPDKAAGRQQAIDAMKELVDRANAKGQAKVTAKDGDGAAPKERMTTIKTSIVLEKGTKHKWREVETIAALFPDTDWYEGTGREDTIKVVENVSVKIIIRRPAKEEAAAAEAEASAPAEAAPVKRRGRKAAEVPPEHLGVEVDPMTMGDLDDTEAPNLRELGIVDASEDAAAGL
jgi:ParB/RepB/Spo0J family partition protein